MRRERLFHILGFLDEDLIEESDSEACFFPAKRPSHRMHIAVSAACLALICSAALIAFSNGNSKFSQTEAPAAMESPETEISMITNEVAAEEETAEPGNLSFMSYAGSVFPLTLTEEADGLTATRTTIWNFEPQIEDAPAQQRGTSVSDRYLLTNSTNEEIKTSIAYPYAGNLAELDLQLPSLTIDGTAKTAELLVGAYAGGFRDAGLQDGSTWNLAPPDSWSDYQVLLADNRYRENSAVKFTLDVPVTVYSFTEFEAPQSYDTATQVFQCTIDEETTRILSYGFNGLDWDEDTGWRQYSYFVPDDRQLDIPQKYLIVIGEDIETYTLQGYTNGACEIPLPDVSCNVTRYETTMDAILEELCSAYLKNCTWQIGVDVSTVLQYLTPDLYREKVAELLLNHGIFSGSNLKDRYSDGRLDEILSETLTQNRILFLTTEVTIPAGETVQITLDFYKEPSFNFACSTEDQVGLQGYDFMTTLGSNLIFTSLSASLVNTENIEITEQNFGFDLFNETTEVSLDPLQEHYFFNIHHAS